MKSVLDLPDEILSELPISHCDLISVVRVCRRFHAAFTPKLYQRIVMDLPYRRHTLEKKHSEWPRELDDTLRKVPTLLNLLLQQSMADHLRRVRSFKLFTHWHYGPEHAEMDSKMICLSAPRIRHLTLGALHLDKLCNTICQCCPSPKFPPLQELCLSDSCLRDSRYDGSDWDENTAQAASRIIGQANLQSLKVRHIPRGFYNYDTCPISYPLQEPNYRSTRAEGKEVILTNLSLSATHIETLVRAMMPLNAFLFIRNLDECPEWERASIGDGIYDDLVSFCRVRELYNALLPAVESLQKLVYVQEVWGGTHFDYSILPPLTVFSRLRILRIDMRFLLGHQATDVLYNDLLEDHPETFQLEPSYRMPREIVTLLPESLWQLDLQVDIEEMYAYAIYCIDSIGYCTSIVQSIVAEVQRLQELTRITFEEFNIGPHFLRYTLTAEGREELLPDLRQSPVTPQEIASMQDNCLAVDILLTYIELGWKDDIYVPEAERRKAPFHVRINEPGRKPTESFFRARTSDHLGNTGTEYWSKDTVEAVGSCK